MDLHTKPLNSKTRSRGGFTLVEVIVVLVILAILAALMVPSITGWIDKAKERSVIVECRSTVLAAQTLYSESYANGKAVDTADIKALASVPGAVSDVEVDAVLTVVHLTYTRSPYKVTYCAHPDTCVKHTESYTVGDGTVASWTSETLYKVGDTVTVGNLILRCSRDITERNKYADPSTSGARYYWLVTGTVDGSPVSWTKDNYYAKDVTVLHTDGKLFKAKQDVGGYSPPTDAYWELVA